LVVEEGARVHQAPGEGLQLCLHLGLQSGQLRLVAALALLSECLQGFALALIGLLAQSVAFFQDADIELELAARPATTRSTSSLMRGRPARSSDGSRG
jgi:hypothetical protein